MKYESRLVWYAPDTTDSATSIDFWRTSTISISIARCPFPRFPTASPSSDCNVQRSNEFCENRVHLIKTCQHIYYIGARIGVFLGKDRSEKCCCGLDCQPRSVSRNAGDRTSRACASAGALPALMHPTARVNSCRVCTCVCVRQLALFKFKLSLVPGGAADRPGSAPQSSAAMPSGPVARGRTPSSTLLSSRGLPHPVGKLANIT